jgi:hypothetical protein
MRIPGYFHHARPHVRVSVFGPAFRRPYDIHFLIDSGAERSALNERDADGRFHAESLAEMATLVHRTRNRKVGEELARKPSVLGQDVLSHYAFLQDPRTGLVLLTNEFLAQTDDGEM